MSALEFLSVRAAPTDEFRPRRRSPLERALRARYAHGIRDRSLELTIFELRGELAGVDDLIEITPRRGLAVTEDEAVEARLREQAATVIDVTAGLAVLRVERPDAATLMRRLTDLDLERLPAAGAVARVPAVVRGGGETFELFWPQEYGHYLAEVLLDAAAGLP